VNGANEAFIVSGTGLHGGAPCSVAFERNAGDVVFRTAHGDVTASELTVERADRGVRVACARTGLRVESVEHLFATLGGLSIRDGVAIEVTGGEVPLADGAALAFVRVLSALDVPRATPQMKIVRAGAIDVGRSRYVFEPRDDVALDVEVEFDGVGAERATWNGDADAFVRDIAWARTFGFRREAAALSAAGRARGVDAHAVMILDEHGSVEPPGAPARPGEFARHKLLDLVGDFYSFGGPPVGLVRASRPGHAATHLAVARALAEGIVVSTNPRRP
jgi:UDP-3-O-[3-hydroxymyristoyl] N-acetylglucosamine deacetylase